MAHRPFSLFFLLLLAFFSMAASKSVPPQEVNKETVEKNRIELNAVIRRLQSEQEALRKAQQQERTLLDELERLDKELENGRVELESLNGKMEETRQQIPILQARIDERQQAMERQRHLVSGQLRLIYGLGEQGVVKLILSQDTASLAQRSVRYYGYLLKARTEQFQHFREMIRALDQAMAEHHSAVARLTVLATAREKTQQQRQNQRQERTDLLNRVRNEETLRTQQVSLLKQAREELTTFVSTLEKALAETVLSQAQYGRISAHKGKLITPVLAQREERPPGLFFKARENMPVRAIFRGHVVYADWFKGYGLLLLLDHGDHIFSLYGHNNRLLVALGDWVEEGEKIADSGDTGSLSGAGLYFELRSQGGPMDPHGWLASGA